MRSKGTKSTGQAGAIHGQVPLTKEHRFHGLAKESLTFFPDRECCPPRRSGRRPGLSRFLFLGRRASLLDEVNAARGGLVGGEGSPELGTSGMPLRPCRGSQHSASDACIRILELEREQMRIWESGRTCGPRSAVVEALEAGSRIDDVARGKDVDTGGDFLTVVTTTIRILVIHGRHCY